MGVEGAEGKSAEGEEVEVVFSRQEVIDTFAQLFFLERRWDVVKWCGIPVVKNPSDLVMLQEIIWETKPARIVETGTHLGGGALFYATILDMLERGMVISVDLNQREEVMMDGTRRVKDLPRRHNIEYIEGNSRDPGVVGKVKEAVGCMDPVIVILDSDHHEPHVLAELEAYSEMVSVDSYLIVEDTATNGHPIPTGFGPGPREAVEKFLAKDDRFVADRERERFLHTGNPMGWLRRAR